ncbi:BTAD domain-containing putative transcriptional regulator [Actinoplanes sp. NPDC051470]|uniref:BTAD domain-containing putative transcriptional regulator n=1 Tax=Actinoplanes sp. NPDC051470 TaxID=3157224 RepID=UPI003437C5F3
MSTVFGGSPFPSGPGGLHLRLLGPVGARRAGRDLDLGGLKPRTLLAELLLAQGEAVSIDRLVDTLWGDKAPARATSLLHTYVSTLRTALRDRHGPVITRRLPGYAWEVRSGRLDLTEFERLRDRGRRAVAAGDHATGAAMLSRALSFWRGTPLEGLRGVAVERHAERLAELHRACAVERMSAALTTGSSGDLIAELVALVARYPLDERLRGQLVTALHRAGRIADALAAYETGCEVLATQVGAPPGDHLHRAYAEIHGGGAHVEPGSGWATLSPAARQTVSALTSLRLTDVAGWLVDALVPRAAADHSPPTSRQLVTAGLLVPTSRDPAGQTRYSVVAGAPALGRDSDPATRRTHAARAARAALMMVDEHPALPIPGLTYPSTPATWSVPAPRRRRRAGVQSQLQAELGTLVSIVERAGATGAVDECCALAAALVRATFAHRNQFTEWHRTHEAALAAARHVGDRATEAAVLHSLGRMCFEQGRFEASADYHQRALAMLGPTAAGGHAAAVITAGLGRVLVGQGRFDVGLRHLGGALGPIDAAGDQLTSGFLYNAIGAAHLEQGRLDTATECYLRARIAYRAEAHGTGEATALRGAGLVSRARGALEEAAAHFRDARSLFARAEDRLGTAYADQSLAKVELRQGRPAEAIRRLQPILWTCRGLHDTFGEALVLRTLGEAWLVAGSLTNAEDNLRQALHRWKELRLPLWQARTLRDMAWLHESAGLSHSARQASGAAQVIFRRHSSRELTETVGESRSPRPMSRPVRA